MNPRFFSEFDLKQMRLALSEAKKASRTSPNPPVGAVLVEGQQVISTGYHRGPGKPHAEIEALLKAKRPLKNATLYVTLEPCCHKDKRTPPCAQSILNRGITRVVIACKDPNPKVNGRGISLLRKNQIKVEVGCLQKEAQYLIRFYQKWISQKRPYVILKSGMSLDAKIAPAQGTSQWITSESSRKEGHRLRAQVDAILVGSKTVKKDNPELTVRLAKGHSPIRVILDQELNLSLKRKIFLTCSQAPVWVIASKKMKDSPQHCLLLRKKIDVLFCAVNAQGQFDLEDLLSQLGSREITSLQLEGGARLYSSFIETKQVDELHLFVAPKLLGGQGLDLLQNYSGKTLQQAMHFTLYEVKRVGTDLELVYFFIQ